MSYLWINIAVVVGIGLLITGFVIALVAIIKWCGKRVRAETERVERELTRIKEADRIQKEMREKQAELEGSSIQGFERRIKDLDNSIAEKQTELEGLRRDIAAENGVFGEWEEKVGKLIFFYEKLNDTICKTSAELQGLNESKEDVEKEKKLLEETRKVFLSEVGELKKLLEDLKEKKRLAVLNQGDGENDGLWDLDISDHEKKLIQVLKQIKIDYPELEGDIATIEWRKVWLPKLQELGGSEGLKGCRGIYRLVLKSDHKVCYVGQAVDILARWYEHVKKMIGADAKGNEKLYRYRPEDFLWSVLERGPKDLDESERYWIEFFGCKEKGLNKK